MLLAGLFGLIVPEGRKGRKGKNGTNGREEGVRKKGTHVSSSPLFFPFSLYSPFSR
jgi:hypothetical protein